MNGATFVLAAYFLTARAQELWTGNRLYLACQKGHTPSSDCAVFIRGVVDRYHEHLTLHCAPQRVSFGDIVERVVADLEASPAAHNRPAPKLILDSIGKAYECRLPDTH